MENVAIIVFKVESEGYQAFSALKRQPVTAGYVVSQFDLVKRDGDRIVACDSGDSGINTTDDALRGGLVGAFVGVLAGPLGVLLGGAYGTVVGTAFDAKDVLDNQTMIETAALKLYDGEVAIVTLVQEDNEAAFDGLFAKYDCIIIRRDAAEVAREVEDARDAQAELQRQAKEAIKEQRKADRQQRIEARRASIKASFEEIKGMSRI